MSADLKGYYARLGVPSSASEAEIKAAYRKFAKEIHPDVNRNVDGGASFKAVTEAYRVLGDTEARAEYDSLSVTAEATSHTGNGTLIEPICCSNCGKVTAQPRYVAFRHVVSFVVGTVRSPIQGIFCAQCARSKALTATAISSVAGWWGVPLGPIWTVLEGGKNALGGHTVASANENLLWHNALAFGLQGNDKLSLGLADKLRSARDREIASNAAKLIEHFRIRGVTLGQKTLKNPWTLSPVHVLIQFAMIFAGPVALAVAIYPSTKATSEYPGIAPETSTYASNTLNSLYAEPPAATSPTAAPAPIPTATPSCNSPPRMAEFWLASDCWRETAMFSISTMVRLATRL